MKKWILVIAVVLIFTAFAVYQHDQAKKSTPVAVVSSTTSATTTPATPTTPITSTVPATSTPATTAAVAPTAEYKDGTYTGSVANAFYGNVQVAAVISGGALTDVQFLQTPNSDGHSVQVNTMAAPQLKSEAIAAQSAQVNVVSGATQTSQAFVESLGNALSQAKA